MSGWAAAGRGPAGPGGGAAVGDRGRLALLATPLRRLLFHTEAPPCDVGAPTRFQSPGHQDASTPSLF